MLEFLEKHFEAIRTARSDGDVVDTLKAIAVGLGYHSAYLIEYASGLDGLPHIIDSDRHRAEWWREYFKSGQQAGAGQLADMLARGGVQQYRAGSFSGQDDRLLAFARKMDMVDGTLVPVSFGGRVVGVAGMSGAVELTPGQQTSLQLLIYSLFAQVRAIRSGGIFVPSEGLTPREKEVIALSAEGLTSAEIAERLGLSARTVNQHVDNVADKLGTKNRTHTIAEAIRHGLLH
jgi:LuxR family transcriptional regulator, quorum-sensing system regulator BjaR1